MAYIGGHFSILGNSNETSRAHLDCAVGELLGAPGAIVHYGQLEWSFWQRYCTFCSAAMGVVFNARSDIMWVHYDVCF